MKFYSLSLLLSLVIFLPVASQSPVFPPAPKKPVIDTFFDQTVCDNYRWMENLSDPDVVQWLEQQDALTHKFLRKAGIQYNSYKAIDYLSYARYSNPVRKGNYYFTYAYFNNTGVPGLFVRRYLKEDPSLLLDPNFISKEDKIILRGFSVSGDSRLLAYQFNRNGSDVNEIGIINISTGNPKPDKLENVRFSNIAWKDDGFYYSYFPKQGLEAVSGQEIRYHKLGQDQSQDQIIFKQRNPDAFSSVVTTSDERYLVLTEENEKNGRKNIFFIDFEAPVKALRPLIMNLESEDKLSILDNYGERLVATTFKDADHGMLVTIDPSNPQKWEVLIPNFEEAFLLEAKIMSDKIIGIYRVDRKQRIVFFNYQSEILDAIELDAGFFAKGFSGEKNDEEITFSYSGYTQPPVVYILDMEKMDMKPLKATVVNFDYTQYEGKEVYYSSADGTSIPLFLIHRKDLDMTKAHPSLLEAYGGFGIVPPPAFDPGIVHFLDEGGVYAFAHIRDGWSKENDHLSGFRGKDKQKSIEDFIAAAEFLIGKGYTSAEKLAITGASNGGLVIGAAMIKRPDLFRVAVPVVAPLDMLRFEKFTVGHFHTDAYGSVEDPAGFKNLLSYSPLHNIAEDVNYPATLIMTSFNDDRVPPFHSFKFAAGLQNRKAQKNPVLLRVERNAGHYGAEGSFKSGLREKADMYNFILYHLKE